MYVNDTRVSGQAPLRDGDVLWLGKPGDETSVMLQCRMAGAALPVVVMPEEDLSDLLAVSPAEPPPPASPVAAAPEAPSEDVFFMEEPAAPAAAAPPPPSPPPPAEDNLFFVEEPFDASASPPAAAAPVRPAPAPEPPPVPPPKASAAAKPAPPPIRRHGPTPPPSAAPERDDEAEPPRPRSVAPRPVSTPRAATAPGGRRSSPPVALIAGAALLLVAVGAGVLFVRSPRAPAIASITPARVGLGQSVTIAGTAFGATPQANVVSFGGKPGRVVQASPTRLQVEIPEVAAVAGRDTPVPVVVLVDGRESKAATVAVFEAPRIHGISPSVAMPGEEVVLAGAGWGAGATVQFGSVAATVLDASPTSLKVTVPALQGAPGTEFPVRVTTGADTSNAAPFVVGRLPLVLSISPASAAPGDVVTVAGRGFDVKPAANDVRVGGTRALVAAASGSELKVIVPRAAPGETTVDVRLPGVEHVGQSRLVVAAPPDPIDLRFVAEPFEDTPGHEHAVLTTGLGPAFVLSASGGRSVGERALEAERRLNEAGAALKGTVDGDVRARGLDGSPSLVVAGRDAPLLDVTIDDAAGYEEDWTGLKDRAGPISPARVAVWWEAVARDLVLLLVRGDKPHFAADLAPEGRVLADLHPLARKYVTVGVPRQVIAEARPPMREALRTVGLRIPASVKEPSAAAPGGTGQPAGATTAGPAAGPVLRLDGRWSGSETDSGRLTYITAVFAGSGGTFTYERALSVTQPLLGVVQQKGAVRFSVQTGAGPRYYQGKWDGQKVTGTVSVDPGGKTTVGTFELAPG
ncbi:MAG: hypothetical protein DMF77_19085 [Acidobacteria bacterium]|nr:MAG: hypothetical protein DMF77_19085 [Acidobacteriota bacterium]